MYRPHSSRGIMRALPFSMPVGSGPRGSPAFHEALTQEMERQLGKKDPSCC